MIENFDAYGQVLPKNVLPGSNRDTIKASGSKSAILSRIGQYIFWLLVVVIVFARIFYFSASPTFESRNVHDTKRATVR